MQRSTANRSAPAGFREAIDSALELLRDYAEAEADAEPSVTNARPLDQLTDPPLAKPLDQSLPMPKPLAQPLPSLLEQCEQLLAEAEIQQPPPIRTIHHLACTGGTLISRCIAAQPNTHLLSEVDPLSPFVPGGFLPTDLIGLSRFGSRPASVDTQIELFLAGLAVLYAEAQRQGQHLILRDHSHGQFHFGDAIPERPQLRAIIQRAYPTRSVVSVRHPFDSYLSLQDTGWVQHFSPPTLDEYARRVHAFLDAHADCTLMDGTLIRYEDVVADPSTTLQRLCEALALSYNPGFIDTFSAISLSGDSGRRGDHISPRPRRAHPPALAQEARDSEVFQSLLQRLDYRFD